MFGNKLNLVQMIGISMSGLFCSGQKYDVRVDRNLLNLKALVLNFSWGNFQVTSLHNKLWKENLITDLLLQRVSAFCKKKISQRDAETTNSLQPSSDGSDFCSPNLWDENICFSHILSTLLTYYWWGRFAIKSESDPMKCILECR